MELAWNTYLHKFQFQVLSHVIIFYDPEKGCDDVSGGITHIIELLQPTTSIIKFSLKYMANHILYMQGMRLITDLKNKQIIEFKCLYISSTPKFECSHQP